MDARRRARPEQNDPHNSSNNATRVASNRTRYRARSRTPPGREIPRTREPSRRFFAGYFALGRGADHESVTRARCQRWSRDLGGGSHRDPGGDVEVAWSANLVVTSGCRVVSSDPAGDGDDGRRSAGSHRPAASDRCPNPTRCAGGRRQQRSARPSGNTASHEFGRHGAQEPGRSSSAI